MKEKLNIKYSWVFFAAATFFCSVLLVFVLSVSVNAANSSYSYYFTVTNYAGTAKYDCVVSSDNPIVVTSNITSSSDLSEHFYEFNRGASFVFYTLDATGNNLITVQPSVLRSYTYTDGEWVLENDYESTGVLGSLTRRSRAVSDYGYGVGYYNFAGSGLDILKINITDKTPRIVDGNVVGIDIDNHSFEANIASYLINKKFVNVPLDRNFVLTKYSTADKLTPSFAYSYYGTSFVNTSSFSVLNAQIDEDGVLSFEDFVVNEEDVKFKGVIAYFYDPVNQQYYVYDKILSSSYMYQLNLGGVQLATVVDGALEYKNYTSIVLQPYYVSNDDILYSGDRTYLTLDSSAEYYNRTDIYVLENIRKTASSSDKGVTPEDGDLEGGILDGNTYDNATYDSTIGTIQNLQIENELSSDCHGSVDGFTNCFSLSWDVPTYDESLYMAFYDFQFKMKYSYMNYYSMSAKLTTDTALVNYGSGVVSVKESSWLFCTHEFCDLLGLEDGLSNFDYISRFNINDLEKIYVRQIYIDRRNHNVTYGNWAIFDVNYSNGVFSLNQKQIGSNYIYSGDSEIDENGNVDGEILEENIVENENNGFFFGGINLTDIASLGTYFVSLVESLVNVLGGFPSLFARVFSFLPIEIINMIYMSMIIIIIAGFIKIFV